MKRLSWSPASFSQFGEILMFTQMCLFEKKAQADGQESASADSGSNTDQQADSYLQKGERLISLARKKFERILEGMEFSLFEQALYGVKVNNGDYVDAISKFVRTLMRREELDSPMYKGMLDFLEFDVSLFEVDSTMAEHAYFRPLSNAANGNDKLLGLTIREEGFHNLNVYGLKNHTHPGRWKNVLYKNGDACADLAQLMAVLICCSIIKRILKESDSEAYMALYEAVLDKADPTSGYDALRGIRGREGIVYEDVLKDVRNGGLFHHPFWCDSRNREYIAEANGLEAYLASKGVTIQYIERAFNEIKGQPFNIPDFPVYIDHSLRFKLWSYDPWGMLTHGGVLFHNFLEQKENRYWANPRADLKWELDVACKSYFEEKMTQAKALNYLRGESASHAKSFEDKKIITQKCLKAMEESLLNDHFGYVEYDEDIDLKLVSQVIDEFIGFKEKYLPMIDCSENAIRFRKLGNHKAIGLYYPFVKCLCVDFRYVYSFIHELGHLVDYQYGNLSLKGDFVRVRERYESGLRRAMREDQTFGNKMNGKSKYSLDYFLTPTEIFARSFELYFSKVLGVETSLVPETFGQEYPTDELFLKEVKEYFDALLLSLKETSDSESLEVCASC